MKLILCLSALLVAATAARAQTVARDNGEAAAPLLQLTTVPRAAALGGALAAAPGVTSIFANPAGAAALERLEAHAAGQSFFDGARAGTVAVGFRIRRAAVALGAQYLDLGTIDEVVCDGCGGRGTPTGQRFSASERALTLAGALSIGLRASVGAAIHYYGTTLADASGNAVSVSAGGRAALGTKLALGASVQYVGGEVDVAGFAAPLPRTFRLGAEYRPTPPERSGVQVALAAEYSAVRGAPGRLGGGVEAGVVRPGTGLAALARLGMSSTAGGDFGTSALSVGGALRFRQVTLDYAYQGSEALGGMHRLGITYRKD